MWYVVQVRTGNEDKMIAECKRAIPEEVLERCFIPYIEEKKKINGKIQKVRKHMFPGYIFLISDKLDELKVGLKKVFGFAKILKTGDDVVPISEKEVDLLKRFGLDEKEIVEMSEGIIEGTEIIVTEGPLIGLETFIKRINRHKRKAWIETEMFGRKQEIEIGLEIVMKK